MDFLKTPFFKWLSASAVSLTLSLPALAQDPKAFAFVMGAGSGVARTSCVYILDLDLNFVGQPPTSFQQKPFSSPHLSPHELELRLKGSPTVIFSSPTDGEPAKAFHASNEADWYLGELDDTPTDLLVGFGTNSAWDLAVRKNAKELIIGDWTIGPLVGQEYLLKPLILLADSRAEFLSFISGIEIKDEMKHEPISKVFGYLYSNRGELTSPHSVLFQESVVSRLTQKHASAEVISAVQSYYGALRDQFRYGAGSHRSGEFGPFVRARDTLMYNYFYFFKARYNPEDLINQGAPVDRVMGPMATVFSSDQAFSKLQNLFNGHVHYFHGSLFGKELVDSISSFGRSHGIRSFSFSLTNIVDVSTYGADHADQVREALEKELAAHFASPTHPVEIYETQRDRPPHMFTRKQYKSPDEVHNPRKLIEQKERGAAQSKLVQTILQNPGVFANAINGRIYLTYGATTAAVLGNQGLSFMEFSRSLDGSIENLVPLAAPTGVDGARVMQKVLKDLETFASQSGVRVFGIP